MLTAEEYGDGIAQVQDLLAAGASLDEAIARMKQIGFSPIESIKGLMEVTGSPLADATRAVHFSSAWPELRS
jgi:hypothetical protein